MKDNKMTVIDEKNNERLCTIEFTHEIDGKTYVVFQYDDTKEYSAAQYIPNPERPEEGEFLDINDDAVWDELEEVLSEDEDE